MSLKTITLDAETSGVDTENDRIITFFMRAKDGSEVVYEESWILDPGIEIPEGAAEVHGMSTEWVREHGRKDVAEAIIEIVTALENYALQGFIVCGYNHSFDLALLDAESRRHCEGEGLDFPTKVRFIDPLIIDRAIDKYRKGSRKLVDVAKHYGIEVDPEKAHAADYDVYLSEQLVTKVLNKAWAKLSEERKGMTPDEFITYLQPRQREWKREWAEGLTTYFAKQGKLEEDGSPIVVKGAFPY